MNSPKPAPATKRLIAVVDDELDILELIQLHLSRAGFAVKSFAAARPLLRYLEKQLPDLLVLDLMLPDGDGLDICQALKRDVRTRALPILILTAKGDKPEIVLGLEFGADDYMVKPFSPPELVARVRAVLRRSLSAGPEEKGIIRVGDMLVIDPGRHSAVVGGQPVILTSTEFSILLILSRNPGWVFSRERILDTLWGDEKAVIDRTIDVHIRHLREKLGPAGSLIKNIRGVGYKIEP
ncbi:MAG: response regulator transcription factor [Candidatus Aminicenantes bacterium]|nr:response regulator transcription factor [Candidatus Aminicenantes bacterium]